MRKAKITQEQANAIRDLKEGCTDTYLIRKKYRDPGWFAGRHKPIVNMNELKFIDALRIGYEVEPEFEVDQWVKSRLGVGIGVITKISKLGYHTDFNMIASAQDIRHATPEEIAQEKYRRTGIKLDKILLELSSAERIQLKRKLNCGKDV